LESGAFRPRIQHGVYLVLALMTDSLNSWKGGTLTWIGSTRTRSKLIEATARVALKHGLRSVTVRHILEEASLSRRTFYQHFKSKEEAALALYRSVSIELVGEMHQGLKAADGLTDRLAGGVREYLTFQSQVGDLLTMLRAEAVDPDSILAPMREENLDTLGRLLDNEVYKARSVSLDPLVYRGLLVGLEAMASYRRVAGELVAPDFDRVAEVGTALFVAMLTSDDVTVQVNED
jgi:AcrR family transcriptional regulator